ncbi:MAG: type II toxin-antitoxin system Phd/YefM family antitoxin [Nitrospirales bacterium]
MVKEIPITEARHELTSLPKRLAKTPGTVAVTRRDKPVLAILPWKLYESLMETLDILEDEELMEALRRGVAEAEAGKSVPWEDVKRELKL